MTDKDALAIATDIEAEVKKLTRALEMGLYGIPQHEQGLRQLLVDLGVTSARGDATNLIYGGSLQIEGLEATLKQVGFNMDKLKKWTP